MEHKETRARLGAQLAAARRYKGWTLMDLGQRTANAASRLSGIENGKFNATVDALAQVGEAAGLTLTFVPTEKLEEVMALIGQRSDATAYPTAVRSLHDEVFIPDPSEEEERASGYGRP
jgi:transcriptional regulator with XRE-family HTH domain